MNIIESATQALQAEAAKIEQAIAVITQQLKVPGLSNVERLLLHEDRKDMRDRLAEIRAQINGGARA